MVTLIWILWNIFNSSTVSVNKNHSRKKHIHKFYFPLKIIFTTNYKKLAVAVYTCSLHVAEDKLSRQTENKHFLHTPNANAYSIKIKRSISLIHIHIHVKLQLNIWIFLLYFQLLQYQLELQCESCSFIQAAIFNVYKDLYFILALFLD